MLKPQFSEKAKDCGSTTWQAEIIARLESAMAGALPTWEYNKLKQEQNQLFKRIRRTGKPQYVGEFLKIEDMLEISRIHFYTLPEFRLALGHLGYHQGEIAKILAHQNALANVADDLAEARIVYLLEISKASPGTSRPYTGHSSVRVFHPADWLAEEIQGAETQIRLAPKTYGSELVCSDGETLNLLHPLSFSF